jgi:glycosyltransferase involved in cell wall biosynthesis
MVRPDGRYCFQRTIDFAVCATCVPDLGFTIRRSDFLRPLLDSAALLLTPSAFHRDLHVANGFDPDRIVVNTNGVRVPNMPPRDKTPRARVRFGFVGGTGPLKGLDLIRAAFAGIARTDWELILVDNTLNLGFSSLQVDDWSLPGVVQTIPAYTQDSMDAFFEGLDVLLFPSQWKESFGLPVREAQARNVWVIVTEAGGAAEDVVDGVNGRIIPMGADPAPLRAAIDETLVRRSMFQGYVNPHRDSITTIDAQAAELGDLLEGVVIDHAERHTDTTHVAAD